MIDGVTSMTGQSPSPVQLVSRMLQNSRNRDDGNFNHFAGFLFWYAMLLLCCIIPTICEWRRRRRQNLMESRLVFLQNMAASGVLTLGVNMPNDPQGGDSLEEKMKKIDAATQVTTMEVTSKDLVEKPMTAPITKDEEAKPVGITGTDEEAPAAVATSSDAEDNVMEDVDLEDGEEFAALKLSSNHPNARNREVAPSCAICLCPYEVGDSVTFSPSETCQHAFHKECIGAWMAKKKHPLCPCCRQEFCSLDGTVEV